MRFIKQGSFWKLQDSYVSIICKDLKPNCVDLNNQTFKTNWLSAPIELGYKCTEPPLVVFIKNNESEVAIKFRSFQVQPFGVQNGKFGNVDDCVGFFSIGVWSVLIVSFVLIAIFSYGLVMLSSVQPYELYEDAKKKHIQLGADN